MSRRRQKELEAECDWSSPDDIAFNRRSKRLENLPKECPRCRKAQPSSKSWVDVKNSFLCRKCFFNPRIPVEVQLKLEIFGPNRRLFVFKQCPFTAKELAGITRRTPDQAKNMIYKGVMLGGEVLNRVLEEMEARSLDPHDHLILYEVQALLRGKNLREARVKSGASMNLFGSECGWDASRQSKMESQTEIFVPYWIKPAVLKKLGERGIFTLDNMLV